MERLSFAPEAARRPSDPLLKQVTVAPLTEAATEGSSVQAAVLRLGAGGRIARHRAAVPQLLAVLEESGWVSGRGGTPRPIGAGEAVFWSEGEEHETRTDDGLTAFVLEVQGLTPFRPAS